MDEVVQEQEQEISSVVKYGKIPISLWRECRSAAAAQGMTMRQYVVQALAAALKH